MKRSTERILTTHVGSLPRPDDLLELVSASGREGVDAKTRLAAVRRVVGEMVRLQAEHGVDVLNDGEQGKEGYATYVRERLTGFDGEGEKAITQADIGDFPGYLARLAAKRGKGDVSRVFAPPACTGPIRVKDSEAVKQDIEILKAATAGVRAEDVFVTAASPGVIALFFANHHYPTREKYLEAIAEAMREEYEAIAAAGFVLQLDCPDLAMGRHFGFANESLETFLREAQRNVEALNHATRNIPAGSMRMHLCWGNYEGPHHRDVDLIDVIDVVLAARPLGLALEASNPRHAHEWAVFEGLKLPEGKLLIPGVVDSKSNYIEHPELVAERLVRYAKIVGKENVMAGTDCGFGTFAGISFVDTEIVWAKLDAMAKGARIADRRLA